MIINFIFAMYNFSFLSLYSGFFRNDHLWSNIGMLLRSMPNALHDWTGSPKSYMAKMVTVSAKYIISISIM